MHNPLGSRIFWGDEMTVLIILAFIIVIFLPHFQIENEKLNEHIRSGDRKNQSILDAVDRGNDFIIRYHEEQRKSST